MAALSNTVEFSNNYKDPEHPRNLIPELCRQFYQLDWVTGTGGGISIKYGNEIFIAPSGVQKERIKVSVLEHHTNRILTRYIFLQLIPYFYPKCLAPPPNCLGETGHYHKMVDFPVTKFFFPLLSIRYDEELVVPIIENTPEERDLKESMAKAMEVYPDSCAVLVRRHGVYVWGDTWQKAKTMCECLDYLCDIATRMKLHGLDPTTKPMENNAAKGYDYNSR
ncbi:PREDICTED: methylthioribulose-1-phosphate dehydratase-like [Acropora digitifera]|uniref:methylthioribulose-1-phosphate dehydratase-like n=1 Tax=Acropora digitifera TaxID=70779 RepID=UPI00077A5514|nr:PREDICTED: methylthioribulose-1-phosphate dehydratase-like [Acropora digitifera]